MRCREDIAPGEVFLYIPNKCIISAEHAKLSEIGAIFKNHDSLFVTSPQREYLILLVYILYEMTKGEESFYHSYFEAVGTLEELACWWETDVIEKYDDPVFRSNLTKSKEEHTTDWESI